MASQRVGVCGRQKETKFKKGTLGGKKKKLNSRIRRGRDQIKSR